MMGCEHYSRIKSNSSSYILGIYVKNLTIKKKRILFRSYCDIFFLPLHCGNYAFCNILY